MHEHKETDRAGHWLRSKHNHPEVGCELHYSSTSINLKSMPNKLAQVISQWTHSLSSDLQI